MKKLSVLLVLPFFILFFTSCKKNKVDCVKVKYVGTYCPKAGAVLVNIESDPGSQLALLNVPEDFQVIDKVFYVTYHYDASLDTVDPAVTCQALYGPAQIFVTDSASDTRCNN